MAEKKNVEYYDYVPYGIQEMSLSYSDLHTLFNKFRQDVQQLHKLGWYYLDWTLSNVRSVKKSYKAKEELKIRCIDIDSFIHLNYTCDVLFDFKPSPPEFSSSFKMNTKNIHLYSYCIWQLGIFFFRLLTNGKFPNFTPPENNESNSQKMFDPLLPDLSMFDEDQTHLTLPKFMDLGSQSQQSKALFNQVLGCLETNISKRILNFETL